MISRSLRCQRCDQRAVPVGNGSRSGYPSGASVHLQLVKDLDKKLTMARRQTTAFSKNDLPLRSGDVRHVHLPSMNTFVTRRSEGNFVQRLPFRPCEGYKGRPKQG